MTLRYIGQKYLLTDHYLPLEASLTAARCFFFQKFKGTALEVFQHQQGSSVRALNFTPDGTYIGAATLAETRIF